MAHDPPGEHTHGLLQTDPVDRPRVRMMPERKPAASACLAERMRPSEYTAAALRVIGQRGPARAIRRAIEIGTGSGVLLAALAQCGAEEIWGVDIDPDALLVAGPLLAREAAGKPVHLLLGDVWRCVPRLRFDAIVANLPHFPAILPPAPGRNPYWSGGGRGVLDVFLDDLAQYLARDGVAWITHHALTDLDRTEQRLLEQGLTAEKVFSWTVYEPKARMRAIPPAMARPDTVRCLGGYHFVEAHVLEIRHAQKEQTQKGHVQKGHAQAARAARSSFAPPEPRMRTE